MGSHKLQSEVNTGRALVKKLSFLTHRMRSTQFQLFYHSPFNIKENMLIPAATGTCSIAAVVGEKLIKLSDSVHAGVFKYHQPLCTNKLSCDDRCNKLNRTVREMSIMCGLSTQY